MSKESPAAHVGRRQELPQVRYREGIDVGETKKLNWDNRPTNRVANVPQAVYADKSVGDAVRFDFLREVW